MGPTSVTGEPATMGGFMCINLLKLPSLGMSFGEGGRSQGLAPERHYNDHIIFGRSGAVPRANEHARAVPGMTLCAAKTPSQHDLPDLACGWTKSHSGHISGMLICTGKLHWSIQKLYGSLPLG